ncbi:TetR/AcrR family transcriptional regulator [Rhodococcus artemisiae]|uniref:Helix-turn-helix domain-containing protein n=1 Tax=Rhodococcus artemisiae TaxID=714159 RepID=A0ABU7L6S0_9NOCA|nr:helix-turn-helix domain-containing protein [Rhodococcus artemisiae]MEE2057241.1 helix-turn-helix domain-containing protein [Rhodococcus artemisiae]
MMIKAAYRVLSLEQSHPVTVSAICAQAGLSTRSFYRHFRSKDDLLLAVLTEETNRAADELADRLRKAGPPMAGLEEWIRFFLSLSSEPRRRRRVKVMDSPEIIRAVGYAATMEQISARHRDPLVLILRQGAADGSFRTSTPESDAAIIQDIVMNASFRRRRESVDENHHIGFAQIIDFVSRAIGPDS